jgi:hypothetical protein
VPIYEVQGPDGTIYDVEGPENADPNILIATVAQHVESPRRPTSEDIQQRIAALKPEYGFGETLSRGASRGFTRLGSTAFDVIPAMVASGLGFDDYAKEQLGEAAQTEQELARTNAPEFQSYKDVEGVGDALKFASQVGSEQLANLATAIVPGVGLGGLAARGAVGTAAQIAAKKAAGQMVGTYLGSYALNAPEVFQNVYEETGTMAPGASALFATASAALDSFLPASLMRTMPASLKAGIVERLLARSGMNKGLLRSVTSNVIKDTTGEAVTEAAQEGISIAAERFINEHPEAFGKEEWDRIMESAVQGGVGGGVFGVAGGAAERASERQQTAARAQNIQQIREARVAKEQRETDLGGQMELAGVPPLPPGTPATQPVAALPDVANRNYVFQRGRQLGVIKSGKLENLTQTEQNEFDALYKAENERVLFARAAAEAEVQGVPFDTNKTLEELNPEERAILNTVAKQKPEDQEAMFTASGAPTKPFIAKEKEAATAQKEADRLAAAETKAAATAQKEADRLAAAETKAATIRARQEAQRQAAAQKEADRLAKEQERKTAEARATGLAEVAPKEIDLLAGSRPPLERVLGTDFTAKAQKDLDAAAAKQGKLQAGRPTPTPAPATTTTEINPGTTKEELNAFGKVLGVGNTATILRAVDKTGQSGPLVGLDRKIPEQAKRIREVLEAYANGKPAEGAAGKITKFLEHPDFQVAPAQPAAKAEVGTANAVWANKDTDLPVAVYNEAPGKGPDGRQYSRVRAANATADSYVPTDELKGFTPPTPTPTTEETRGQAQTVKTETQERQVGQETSETTATGESSTDTDTTTTGTPVVRSKSSKGRKGGAAKGTTASVQSAAVEKYFPKGVITKRKIDSLVRRLVADPQNTEAREASTWFVANADDAQQALFGGAYSEARKAATGGGKVYLENATASSKLEGDLLDAVTSGDLKKTISLLIAKMAGRPEAQQVLRKIQSLGLKTKIVVGAVSDAGLPMFAGPTALSADIASLAEVQQLLASGADPEQVRQNTGWFKDVSDGKWRFEVSDSDARMITPVTELTESPLFGKATKYKLSEVLDHPALYAAYPDAADIDFVVRRGFMDLGGLQGSFDGANQIQVTPYAEDPESTILHEVQHWVQTREGFAQGGNENSAVDAVMSTGEAQKIAAVVLREARERVAKTASVLLIAERFLQENSQLYAKFNEARDKFYSLAKKYPYDTGNPERRAAYTALAAVEKEVKSALGIKPFDFKSPEYKAYNALAYTNPFPDESGAMLAQLRSELVADQQKIAAIKSGDVDALRKIIKDSGQAYNLYRRLAGEIEARNTQARQKMTPAERIYNPPEVTADVKAGEAIVVMFGEDTAAISRVGNREFYASQRAGSYDPVTDTITLDPDLGLNEHTLTHELTHAALVHALANPELEVTKQFTKFFNEIKDRMGDAYGGQDLQEFAAELVSNPEFQALLKSIKAPRSGSLWERIMQAVAEFFGFRERQSAYDAGFKFVSDVLDVSGDQKADIADTIFYGPGKLNELGAEVAAAAQGTQDRVRDALSNAGTMGLRRAILGAVSLNDMDSMVGDKLPIRELETAVESKRGAIDQGIDRVSKIVRELMRVENKYSEQVKRMNRMAIDARRAGVDLLNPQFKPTPNKQAEYTRLLGVYNSLPSEVRNAYRLMREDLDSSLKKFTTLLQSFLSPSAAQKLLQDFANMEGVIGYMPFMRYGEYWIEYTDPNTGERTPMAFESDAARTQAISALKRQYPKLKIDSFMNIQNVKAPKDLPAASFISKTINEMRANKVSEDVVNEVYQQYYLMFPANSIMKQFTKAKLLPGMNEDMIRAYSDVAVKWVNKLANTEYNPKIVTALDRIRDVAGKEGKYSDDMNIQAVASSIEGQRESFLNLNYSPIARALTTGSYYLHILGSVASAVVNLTGLPFFVYPILGGRFGYGATMSTMTEAGTEAARGWGESWSKGKYKALYTSLNDRGLLQHTTAREALERSKTTGKELGGLTTKVIDLLSTPFNASERYMRATTAIAAYELARKGAPGQKPMSEAEAIEFAAKTVKDTHTAGMSEVSPEYFKNDFGRVILTFKKIGFQQATVIALAFHRAFLKSDLDPKVKDVARRQLLGIFGMSGAFLGAAGLPFYGAFSVLGRMLAAMFGDDDDEPYDFNMQMREISGDFYEGLLAKALNIDISKRAALASDILWRDDPLSVQNYGYARTLLANLAGPMGNYAINAERAVTEIERGNVERGIETLLPTFIANGMKGIRYMTEGAETLDGDPIESDINVLNALGQMAGFAPADLADLQERRSAAKQYEAAVLARKQRILDGYNMARADGDPDMAREFQKQAAEFRRKYPGLMGTDTLQRSVRSREAAQEEMMRGIRISKSLQRDIEKRFKLGED